MASLSAPRNTPEYAPNTKVVLAAGGTIYTGGMVAVNSSGAAVAASDATGLKVIGRAENNASSGDSVTVRIGVFKWDNDTTNDVDSGDIGQICYVVDDHTVGTSGGSHSVIAGYVKAVESDGVVVSPVPVTVAGLLGSPSAAISDVTAASTTASLNGAAINSILAALRKAGIIASA